MLPAVHCDCVADDEPSWQKYPALQLPEADTRPVVALNEPAGHSVCVVI